MSAEIKLEVTIVENPEYLAGKINAAHRGVIGSGKMMLAYAAEAGRHLIAVKGMLQHGEFKPWIAKNCIAPYDTVVQYMRVAKASKNVDLHTFEGGIRASDPTLPVFKEWVPEATGVSYRAAAMYMRASAIYEEKGAIDCTFSEDGLVAFLDAHATPRNSPSTPHPTPADLSQDDASHALKLQALVERGATEGERDVARRKLEAFAKGFRDPQSGQAYTAEALVEKAQDILPDWQKSPDQIEKEHYRAEAAALRAQLEAIQGRINQLRTDCMGMSREALEEAYIGLVLEREGLTKINEKAAR